MFYHLSSRTWILTLSPFISCLSSVTEFCFRPFCIEYHFSRIKNNGWSDLSVLSLVFVVLLLMTTSFLSNHDLNLRSIVNRDFVFVDDSKLYCHRKIVCMIDLNSSSIVNLSCHTCQVYINDHVTFWNSFVYTFRVPYINLKNLNSSRRILFDMSSLCS